MNFLPLSLGTLPRFQKQRLGWSRTCRWFYSWSVRIPGNRFSRGLHKSSFYILIPKKCSLRAWVSWLQFQCVSVSGKSSGEQEHSGNAWPTERRISHQGIAGVFWCVVTNSQPRTHTLSLPLSLCSARCGDVHARRKRSWELSAAEQSWGDNKRWVSMTLMMLRLASSYWQLLIPKWGDDIILVSGHVGQVVLDNICPLKEVGDSVLSFYDHRLFSGRSLSDVATVSFWRLLQPSFFFRPQTTKAKDSGRNKLDTMSGLVHICEPICQISGQTDQGQGEGGEGGWLPE